MIRRWVLHLESHPGYRPRVSLRRAPFHGQHVVDGGQPGRLTRCPECSGSGYLHVADTSPRPVSPT